MTITNEQVHAHQFLADMYEDSYYPPAQVDRIKKILITLCAQIEDVQPATLDELYQLTNSATEQINELAADFEENGSELETVARDTIGSDFEFIAHAYGYHEADPEDLIASRDW